MKSQTIIIIVAVAIAAILLFSSFKSPEKQEAAQKKNIDDIISDLINEGKKDEALDLIDSKKELDRIAAELAAQQAAAVAAQSAKERAEYERQVAELERQRKEEEAYQKKLADNLASGGGNYHVNGELILFSKSEMDYAKKTAQDIKNDIGRAANGSVNESLYTTLSGKNPLIIWLVNQRFTELDNSWGKIDFVSTLKFQKWTTNDSKPVIAILTTLWEVFRIGGGYPNSVSKGFDAIGGVWQLS